MSIRVRPASVAFALSAMLLSGVTSTSHAQKAFLVNLLDQGSAPLTPTEAVLSAAHNDGLDTTDQITWNNFSLTAPTAGATLFDQALGSNIDAANPADSSSVFFLYAEGLDVDFNNGFTSAGGSAAEDTGNPGDSGTDGNRLYQDVWFSRPGDEAQAFFFSGLDADTYRVYYYATESNNANRSYNVTLQTTASADFTAASADGTAFSISTGNDTEAFVDGLNYVAADITVGAGENLAIFSNVSAGADFASVGAIQIVSTSLLDTRGDVNGDGIVDLSDFNGPGGILENFFNGDGSSTQIAGEAVGARNGIVDVDDFIVWKREFEALGGSTEGLSLAIPEPTSAIMLFGCLAGLGTLRRSV